MGCASSKTGEDKDDLSKQKKHKASTAAAAASASSTATNGQNGKLKFKNANNMSGSLSNPGGGGNTNSLSNHNISASVKQTGNAAANNNSSLAGNSYLNSSNPNVNNTANQAGGVNAAASLIESNNLILLTEFFKAVGNGELEKLKQILMNVDEINMNKTKPNNTNNTNKKQAASAQPPISMNKPELLNAGMIDADGLTALSIAAGRKHKALTEYLADLSEVDVNKASESGITPLLMVAEVGWTDVMRQLLKRGAHVDAAPKGRTAEEAKIAGSTPLIGATKYNNPEAVKLLLENRANPNHQNQSGISALMLASEQGFYECVKNLCDGGANVELAPSGKTALSMNLSGQTPLFCAAKEGHLDIVKYLLDRGANPNATNHYGVSVLWIPCQRGLTSIGKLTYMLFL